jgi:hypothetical protein
VCLVLQNPNSAYVWLACVGTGGDLAEVPTFSYGFCPSDAQRGCALLQTILRILCSTTGLSREGPLLPSLIDIGKGAFYCNVCLDLVNVPVGERLRLASPQLRSSRNAYLVRRLVLLRLMLPMTRRTLRYWGVWVVQDRLAKVVHVALKLTAMGLTTHGFFKIAVKGELRDLV